MVGEEHGRLTLTGKGRVLKTRSNPKGCLGSSPKSVASLKLRQKKTITRRNRRQPNRLDLRGELRNHKAEIIVAIDISGSISDEEFKQAVKEVLSIVKNYNHEITIVECDKEIKNAYKVKNIYDIKNKMQYMFFIK